MVGGRARGRGPEELFGGRAPDAYSDASSEGTGVELLAVGSAAEGQASERATTGSRPTGVVLAGGLVVVVALLALLARPGPSEEPEDEAAPSTTATTTAPASTTTLPATPPPTVPVLDAPVLEEPVGLTLFLGGDTPLTALDLDSGQVTRYGVTAHPVLVTGEDLVLYEEDAGIVGWVPLRDPGQQALSWKRGRVAEGSEPGLLWVLDPEVDEPHPAGSEVGFGRWELFETASNRRVLRMPGDLYPDIERFIEATPMVGGPIEAFRPGPWFSTRRDGVYRAIEDGYTRVAGGRVLVVDDDAFLIEQCTVDGFCDLAWVGVETGELVDRVLPEVRPRVARLMAGGAWLHSVGWAGTSELLELATGRRIEHDWLANRPTISPQGNWLAHWSDTTLVLSDLRDGVQPQPVIGIDLLERGESAGMLFAPTPARAVLSPPSVATGTRS